MRRAEMARRRKNLSEKRNEEEKVLTLPLLPSSFPSLLSIPPFVLHPSFPSHLSFSIPSPHFRQTN